MRLKKESESEGLPQRDERGLRETILGSGARSVKTQKNEGESEGLLQRDERGRQETTLVPGARLAKTGKNEGETRSTDCLSKILLQEDA